MRYIKYLFVTLLMLLATTDRAAAADKCEPELYMFGYAFSFNDSTLYITAVQKVHDVWVKPHNGFVIERETYSHQLQKYFENDGVKNMTCGISFSKKEKQINKKLNKIKERYTKKMKHMRIICLTESDFAFTTVVPLQIETNDEAAQSNKKEKKSKKKNKK